MPNFDGFPHSISPLRHQRPALDLGIAAAEFCHELGLAERDGNMTILWYLSVPILWYFMVFYGILWIKNSIGTKVNMTPKVSTFLIKRGDWGEWIHGFAI